MVWWVRDSDIARQVLPNFFLRAGSDTIYACQDKKDDVKAGVKSTALLFGAYTKPILFLFGSLLVGSWLYCGIANGSHVCYFVSTVVGGAFLLLKQMWHVDLDAPKSCLETVRLFIWLCYRTDFLSYPVPEQRTFGRPSGLDWLSRRLSYGLRFDVHMYLHTFSLLKTTLFKRSLSKILDISCSDCRLILKITRFPLEFLKNITNLRSGWFKLH